MGTASGAIMDHPQRRDNHRSTKRRSGMDLGGNQRHKIIVDLLPHVPGRQHPLEGGVLDEEDDVGEGVGKRHPAQ